MKRKMATAKAKEIYKFRGQTVEPTIGDLKKHLGLDELVLGGLEKARIELNLACAARNLKRIWGIQKKNREGIELRSKPYFAYWRDWN
jgi:hypothetical protein